MNTMSNWASLVLLLATAWMGGGRITAALMPCAVNVLRRVLSQCVMAVAWCIAAVHIVALVALASGYGVVRMPVVAALSLVVYSVIRHRKPAVPWPPLQVTSVRLRWEWGWGVCVLIVGALYAVLGAGAIVRPPSGYDGLYYHLPLIMRWLADGALTMYPDALEYCYPSNCEVWQMMFLSTGSEALLNLSLIPAGIVLALGIAGVSRQLGATSRGAALAAVVVLVCPMVAFQMFGTYVDMFGTAFIVASLYYAADTFSATMTTGRVRANALFCGVAAGIAVGAKLSFAPWAATALAAGCVGVTRHGLRAGVLWSELARTTWRCAAGGMACCGFWLIRSIWHSGSPLFPFQFNIAGIDIGAGRSWDDIQTAIQRPYAGMTALAYPWIEWQDTGMRYAQHYGLGPAVATFGIAAIAYLLWRSVRGWNTQAGLTRLAVLAMTIVGLATFVFVLGSDPRYALPVWIIVMPAVGPILDLGRRYTARATWTVTATAIVMSAAMIALWPSKELLGDLRDGGWTRARAYEIPELIDDLPSGTVIANLDVKAMNYPLFGRHLHNRVIEQLLVRAAGSGNLQAPLSAEDVARHAIDVVYVRGDGPPPFEAGVPFSILFDDTHDARRRVTTRVTRVYGVGSEIGGAATP